MRSAGGTRSDDASDGWAMMGPGNAYESATMRRLCKDDEQTLLRGLEIQQQLTPMPTMNMLHADVACECKGRDGLSGGVAGGCYWPCPHLFAVHW